MPEDCKAKLTLVRGKEKLKASCHRIAGHDGSHTGALKDKDGQQHMIAVWSKMNERWVRK